MERKAKAPSPLDDLEVVIHRSSKRRSTISGKVVGNELHVFVPSGHSRATERRWVAAMRAKLNEKLSIDTDKLLRRLEKRAEVLNDRYFDGKVRLRKIKISRSAKTQYGSCNPDSKEIRVSPELHYFPRWVQDYVLIHEMAHTLEPRHGKKFWDLVNRYEKTEMAKGYLLGWGQRAIIEEMTSNLTKRVSE